MSEPSIERESLAERLREAARTESCPQLLNEAANAVETIGRLWLESKERLKSSGVCMCGQWSCHHEGAEQ